MSWLCNGYVWPWDKILYHGPITKRPASHHIHTKYKSVIIQKIYPIIGAKFFSLPDNISCFNDLDVALYYEVLRLGSGYDRIDVVFDRCFDPSLKEATRISRRTRTKFKVTELWEIPKNFESFLHIIQNKNELN